MKLLAVHPDAQRRGLGRLLLSTLCRQVNRSHEYHILYSPTDSTSDSAASRLMPAGSASQQKSRVHTMYVINRIRHLVL